MWPFERHSLFSYGQHNSVTDESLRNNNSTKYSAGGIRDICRQKGAYDQAVAGPFTEMRLFSAAGQADGGTDSFGRRGRDRA
ncbi:MAG: hypothetical protein WBG75_15800, partial [Mycolicibacter algericus]|uniref:hypothetical protein n=1 Tax=Mycolicibacter algericus TaxID=1288388 RepID=UPI003C762CA4